MWWSSDLKLAVKFTELKGLPAVEIIEYHTCPSKSRIYILRSTESDKIVFFDTRKGPVTIGILNDGDELYLSRWESCYTAMTRPETSEARLPKSTQPMSR